MGTIITSREFNRDVSAAKRAAERGPVTITDRGHPSHVLLSVEQYERLTAGMQKMGDHLWRGQDPSIDLPLPERHVEPERELNL